MRKYVYLFELDSVRKTDKEIITGQKTLYHEIVTNGNIVVMTYNQLVDSRGFFSLLDHDGYQQSLISLFENGAIRISQYGDVRTLSQYLINSVESDKQFIYSALPVKNSQKRLLAIIKRSLMYSDLSELYEYYTGLRSDEDLIDLFVEVEKKKEKRSALIPEHADAQQIREEVLPEMRNILENLYWLLSTVLKLSAMHDIYIYPREPDEYRKLKLYSVLKIVLSLCCETDPLWKEATEIIKDLSSFQKENDDRSVYLREIKRQYDALEGQEKSQRRQTYQYAEAIVSLCYNYACEISICNTSKHYNVEELSAEDAPKPTFQADFRVRLEKDWNSGTDADKRYLLDETNHFEEFDRMDQIPDLSEAVRFTEYVPYREDEPEDVVHRYEYDSWNQAKRQKRGVRKAIFRQIGFSLLCIAIACSLEVLIQIFQNMLDEYISFGTMFWFFAETIAFLAVTEIITTAIARKYEQFLSFSDALGSIGRLLGDAWHTFRGKPASYCSSCSDGADSVEKASIGRPIDFIQSPDLKRYIKFRDQKTKQQDALFAPSDVYPFADTGTQAVVKNLVRLEELHQYRFGVAYHSEYHTMLVDPIENKGMDYFPYERIVPSSGRSGVVIITIHNGNFILLKQFRHAIRSEQYSFPRGFAEPDCTPEEDVIRELKEEIGAVITKQPQYIGTVAADSGLTSTRAHVYCVEIDSFTQSSMIHEGIKSILEIPCAEFERWIGEDNADDGFTLSAYALYKAARFRKV